MTASPEEVSARILAAKVTETAVVGEFQVVVAEYRDSILRSERSKDFIEGYIAAMDAMERRLKKRCSLVPTKDEIRDGTFTHPALYLLDGAQQTLAS